MTYVVKSARVKAGVVLVTNFVLVFPHRMAQSFTVWSNWPKQSEARTWMRSHMGLHPELSRPRKGLRWLGNRLVSWCYQEEDSFLHPVITLPFVSPTVLPGHLWYVLRELLRAMTLHPLQQQSKVPSTCNNSSNSRPPELVAGMHCPIDQMCLDRQLH